MHELSIVMSIIDTVEENAVKHNATVVHEVELEVGMLSGVEFDALDFAFENAPKSNLFHKTVFKILKIHPSAKCNICSFEFETSEYSTPCPQCNSIETELVTGNELRIKSFSFD